MIQSPAGYQGDVRIKRYLDFYQAGYGVAMLSSGVAFSPLSLFANGEPGGWYDPSDLTTLYQDAAGTTPVTAVEQPVGLVLDKSKGLVLGSETSPALSAYITELTGTWAASGANYAFTDTVGGQVRPGVQWPSTSLTPGWYRVVVVVASITGATQIRMNGVGASDQLLTTGTNTRTVLVTVNSRPRLRLEDTSTTIGDGFAITSVSVRELPGNHLFQSTAAARPVLSARVNLLTYTEQFDNAAWAKSTGGSISATNSTTAPDGTLTADTWLQTATPGTTDIRQSVTADAAVSYRHSICVKKITGQWVVLAALTSNLANGFQAFFDLDNAAVGTSSTFGSGASLVSATIAAEANGFYRITIIGSVATSGTSLVSCYFAVVNADNSSTRLANGSCYLWGADLRPANAGVGLPAYQRVGAATSGSSTAAGNADYDTTGFPLYLKFDGTDDVLVSNAINLTSANKVTAWAGVRRNTEGTYPMICEFSGNWDGGANNGTFAFGGGDPGSAEWRFGLRGTSNTYYDPATYTPPITNVLSVDYDISGASKSDAIKPRVNGVLEQEGGAGTTAGTGNFGNYALYVGARGSPPALYLNGHLYSLIVRGAATDAATITSTETWVNQKTLAF